MGNPEPENPTMDQVNNDDRKNRMKILFVSAWISISAVMLLTGCLNLQLGGGSTTRPQSPTVGQQLIDLKRAKDSGVITETEYEAQKARILGHK